MNSKKVRSAFKTRILKDLEEKMVFIGGPRQVGKTTLAQSLVPNYQAGYPGYLNWDEPEHRKIFRDRAWPNDARLIILDEIHKARDWRTLVKGLYDTLKGQHQFLVTGSARLDYFKKGGDSLLGRFYYHRLHPLSLDEVGMDDAALEQLLKFGGFPEPFFKGDDLFLKRWHLQRRDRVIYGDVRDLEVLRDIQAIELLVEALPERVGSPLSRRSLGEDLDVDSKTIERWIQILERVYYCFRIAPYGSPRLRAVKKEQKLYLWDWSEHEDEGKRWENFVASQLLKFCHASEDQKGERLELRFIRNVYQKEIDFVVIKGETPLFAVECKKGDRDPDRHLETMAQELKIPRVYQVHLGKKHRQISDRVRVIPYVDFAKELLQRS